MNPAPVYGGTYRHLTHALAACHLAPGHPAAPFFPDVTCYCLDAPELIAAGSTRNVGSRGSPPIPTATTFSRRFISEPRS